MAISKYALLKKEVSSLINSVKSEETWLADEHIDHAQAMLAKQFKEIGGCQSVCVFEADGCQFVGTPDRNFIQIMNIAGNHWITVSNIGCDKDAVVIHDSLYGNIDASVKEKFVKQMAYMIAPTSKEMALEWADIQKQVGGSDCGLFTIAVATSLYCGVLPQECFWDQTRMRKHLCDCFDKGVMFEFPKTSQRMSSQREDSNCLPLQTAMFREPVDGTM